MKNSDDLYPYEELVFEGLPDWTFLLRYLFMTVLGAAAFIAIAVLLPAYWWAGAIVFALTLAPLLAAEIKRRNNHFILTTERLRDIEGVIGRNAIDLPLDRIMNVSHKQSLFGRMVNSGTLYIESAGRTGKLESEHTHEPSKLQALINKQVEAFNQQGPGHAVSIDSVESGNHNQDRSRSAERNSQKRRSRPSNQSTRNRSKESKYVRQSLEDLTTLRDEDIITFDEYQQKKQELLKRL